MATHEIATEGTEYREFYATGLEERPLLMVVYDAGDADTPKTWSDLFAACYDAHQMFDGWRTGDVLTFKGTPFGRIESYHIHSMLDETALVKNLP